jgi:hypothetical protein
MHLLISSPALDAIAPLQQHKTQSVKPFFFWYLKSL